MKTKADFFARLDADFQALAACEGNSGFATRIRKLLSGGSLWWVRQAADGSVEIDVAVDFCRLAEEVRGSSSQPFELASALPVVRYSVSRGDWFQVVVPAEAALQPVHQSVAMYIPGRPDGGLAIETFQHFAQAVELVGVEAPAGPAQADVAQSQDGGSVAGKVVHER